jgi:uncharacterized protein with HEPN domain
MRNYDYRDYLNGIIKAIDDTQTFIDSMTYEEFVQDQKTLDATIFCIEAIGEATKHIPQSVKTKNPSFPWQQIAEFSDELIQHYWQIDTKAIYKTAKQNLPQLKTPIEEILKNQPQQ